MSCWFPQTALGLARADNATLAQQHLVLMHGEEDTDLPPALLKASAALVTQAGFRDVDVLLFEGVGHQCHSVQIDEICRTIVDKAPKPAHLPDPYIPPTEWLDYSHSRRTTGATASPPAAAASCRRPLPRTACNPLADDTCHRLFAALCRPFTADAASHAHTSSAA